MSVEVHNLQRIALTKETSANFGVDLTGSATYLDLPFREGTATVALNEPNLDPETVQQRLYAVPQGVLGPRQAVVTLTCNLASTGVPAGDGVDSVAETGAALQQLLAICFGGINDVNTGTTFATAADASNFTLTDGADFVDGQAIGWVGARIFELHELADTASVLKQAFSATPTASDVAYAATTIFPTSTPTDSVQLIVEGFASHNRWLLTGGQMTSPPVITRENGQIPTIQFTLTFAEWASLPAQAITPATYANHDPMSVVGEFRINAGGTAERVLYDATNVAYNLQAPVFAPITSGSGINTIGCWAAQRVPGGLGTIEFSIPYEDNTWVTRQKARAYVGFQDQMGVTPGQTVVLSFPRCQVWDWNLEDVNGFAYQRITLRPTDDSFTIGGGTSELVLAAMRMHFA